MKKLLSNRFLFIALVLFSFTPVALADDVDRVVEGWMQDRNIPGAAIAVVRSGKAVKIKGYGLASLEFQVPVSTGSVFEIGSVSKQMTAAGILLLVQDGKLGLDDLISKHLPNTPPSWEKVTVRHLLTHSSGIRNYTGLTGFELSRRLNAEQFIKQLSEHPLSFAPGTSTSYSNSGFNLLAHIIEAKSGKKYLEFLRESIFVPAGMTSSGDRDPRFIIRGRVTGYEWVGGVHTGRDGTLTDLTGAGSIVSTIEDMVKWETALRGDRILSQASKDEMWRNFILADGTPSLYGLGWRISDVRGYKLIGHTGQTAGFGAAIFRYVENDLTVIALTNLGDLGMGSLLATSVAKKYISSLSLKNISAEKDIDPDDARRVSEAYQSFISNDLSDDVFAATLIDTQKGQRAKALRERIVSYGATTRLDLLSRVNVGNRTTYKLRTHTPRRTVLWRAETDEAGRFVAFVVEEEE